MLLLLSVSVYCQQFEFSEYVDTNLFHSVNVGVNSAIQNNSTYNEIVLVAMDNGVNTTLPSWFYDGMNQLHGFFNDATFGNLNYQYTILKKDSTHAFEMPFPDTVTFSGDCDHVHSIRNIYGVLAKADSVYNFRDFDTDNDNIVYVNFTSIGPKSGGVVYDCIDYLSNDTDSYGQRIHVRVRRQSRGSGPQIYIAVFYHETGHDLFGFLDMNHSGITNFGYYNVGGFDVMCAGGFMGVPSLYNPFFRNAYGYNSAWYTPVNITSNSTVTLQDFQSTQTGFLFAPGNLPSGSIPNERFYITFHKDYNQYYANWPFKNRTTGDLLIWHTNNTKNYEDWRYAEIDLECAHGKYIWNETPTNVINTGVQNSLTGRDSLEIRKMVNGVEIAGPYYGRDQGSASIFYSPGDGNNFTFYSNPNSNWYNNSDAQNYSQNITSGFSVKNLRTENGVVKVDFLINDYNITENVNLCAGTWNINGNITVPSGITLTIPSGTILNFNSGDSLVVYGQINCGTNLTIPIGYTLKLHQGSVLDMNSDDTLYIFGTLTSGIESGISTINGGSIIFEGSGSSGSMFKNVHCNNGTEIQCLNGADITIQDCSILYSNQDGIYIRNSSPQIIHNNIYDPIRHGIWCLSTSPYYSTLAITGNTISKLNNNYHHDQGIWIQSSSYPNIGNNIVSGFDYGIYIGGGSFSNFLDNFGNTPYPNNLLTNNKKGLTVAYGSTVFAGSYWDEIGMYNSIHNNTELDLWCWEESYIEAGFNWWGGGLGILDIDSTSYVADLDDYLSTDPWDIQNLAKVKPNFNSEVVNQLSKSTNSDSSSNFSPYTGLLLEKQNRINDAIAFYKDLISKDQFVRIALSQLARINYKYTKTEIEDYLVSLSTSDKKHYPEIKKILGDIYLKNNQFDDAIIAYDNVVKTDPSGYDGISARFEKLFAYLYIKNDPTTASKIMSEIKGINSKDIEVQMLIESLGDPFSGKEILGKDLAVNNIPTTYGLSQNYPNPFNPSTKINYQLPKAGYVSLIIYDILGRQILTLVNEFKSEGKYSANFNANKLASGVYIYQLRSNNFISTKKMILTK